METKTPSKASTDGRKAHHKHPSDPTACATAKHVRAENRQHTPETLAAYGLKNRDVTCLRCLAKSS